MDLRRNRTKHRLAAGETVCCISGLTDPEDIDRFGPADFDAVWLEAEHGAVDFRDIGDLSRACDLWDMTSILRVNQNEQAIIYRALDRGVQGIVVPHINTKAEAENVVAGGKFAPVGQRGLFTSRQGYGVDGYFDAVASVRERARAPTRSSSRISATRAKNFRSQGLSPASGALRAVWSKSA